MGDPEQPAFQGQATQAKRVIQYIMQRKEQWKGSGGGLGQCVCACLRGGILACLLGKTAVTEWYLHSFQLQWSGIGNFLKGNRNPSALIDILRPVFFFFGCSLEYLRTILCNPVAVSQNPSKITPLSPQEHILWSVSSSDPESGFQAPGTYG